MPLIAWVCRYGRQQLSEVLAWDLEIFAAFFDALVEIVADENDAGGSPGE